MPTYPLAIAINVSDSPTFCGEKRRETSRHGSIGREPSLARRSRIVASAARRAFLTVIPAAPQVLVRWPPLAGRRARRDRDLTRPEAPIGLIAPDLER